MSGPIPPPRLTRETPRRKNSRRGDAGRGSRNQLRLRRLLGIPIDHFIEVSLVAFFQIAQVVEPDHWGAE